MLNSADRPYDNNTLYAVIALFSYMVQLAASVLFKEERLPSLFEQRLTWARIIEQHTSHFPFKRHLRMELESFNQLLSYIRHDLEVDQEQAARRGGAIVLELCLYITLRWLAGGSYSDIYMFVGISKSSFYRLLWKTINAINATNELTIRFPSTVDECRIAAAGFETISSSRAIQNCVSVVDGFLMKVVTPPMWIVGNVRSYFSGHYQCYGVNVQAASDHLSRFTYFAVAGPGVMADNVAKCEVDLNELVESLPLGFCVIGDAAYTPSEHWVPVYCGADKKRAIYDNFNYYASQLRIHVEMAFGLMTKKWGVLWKPLVVDIRKVKSVAMCVARLHNYCINERMRIAGVLDPAVEQGIPDRGENIAVAATAAELEYEDRGFPGWSELREEMAKRVQYLNLRHPGRIHNTIE